MRNGRIVDKFGDVRWYLNNELHREDGPAVELASGSCFWYLNDQLHRTSGPAIERANGDGEWRLYGRSYASFAKWLEDADITPEQRTLLLLKWSSHA